MLLSILFLRFLLHKGFLCKLWLFFQHLYENLYLFLVDTGSDYVIISLISIGKSLSKAGYDRRRKSAEAIRTAGSNAENRRKRRLATSVALLVELKAQFYKLVTINRAPRHKLVKWSIRVVKVIFAI